VSALNVGTGKKVKGKGDVDREAMATHKTKASKKQKTTHGRSSSAVGSALPAAIATAPRSPGTLTERDCEVLSVIYGF
jgi:hypothetical protein